MVERRISFLRCGGVGIVVIHLGVGVVGLLVRFDWGIG